MTLIAWTPKGGKPKTLAFDAIMSLKHNYKASPTEHAVEKGANVADHIRQEADSFTLEAVVSNYPVKDVNDRGAKYESKELKPEIWEQPFVPTIGGVIDAVGGAIGNLINGPTKYSALLFTFPEKFDAPSEFNEILVKLKEDGQLLEVYTPSRFYENVVITDIEQTEMLEAAQFSISFRKLRIVESKVVKAPKPTVKRAEPKKSKGEQSGQDLIKEPKASVLSSLLGGGASVPTP